MEKMGLKEFRAKVQEAAGDLTGLKYTQKDAALIVDSFCYAVMKCVCEGNRITLPGFGTFETIEHAPKRVHNVANGEMISLPARTCVKFRPSAFFKDAIKTGVIHTSNGDYVKSVEG